MLDDVKFLVVTETESKFLVVSRDRNTVNGRLPKFEMPFLAC